MFDGYWVELGAVIEHKFSNIKKQSEINAYEIFQKLLNIRGSLFSTSLAP